MKIYNNKSDKIKNSSINQIELNYEDVFIVKEEEIEEFINKINETKIVPYSIAIISQENQNKYNDEDLITNFDRVINENLVDKKLVDICKEIIQEYGEEDGTEEIKLIKDLTNRIEIAVFKNILLANFVQCIAKNIIQQRARIQAAFILNGNNDEKNEENLTKFLQESIEKKKSIDLVGGKGTLKLFYNGDSITFMLFSILGELNDFILKIYVENEDTIVLESSNGKLEYNFKEIREKPFSLCFLEKEL